ncbi:NAD(P)H-quinone oxidoreductase [Vreelandella olivaria]|uniref:NAD(P)H-quinone oxidoreductase n=1 Tax=Vreelandella olivaria TaxID=390919 RepID=UPI00201F8DD5|nr:NAD(P)H-quinone oxidoreductase [Halomonas olivaria]
MQRMTAIIAEQYGPPEVLHSVTRDIPSPGVGELLIKVAAAGVNRPDLMQRGGMPTPPGTTDIFGLEASGLVEAVGPGETIWKVGDRVMALLNGGGYATHCLAIADHCLRVPEQISLIEAAALPEALFTLWHNLYERGRLAPGDNLLIHGGASGLGTLAIALAKATGARVAATAGNTEKVAALRDMGVDLAINYREQEYVSVINETWGANAIHVVLDTVGGDYISRNLEVMAPEGRHVSLSFFAGAEVSLSLPTVMRKGLTLTSSTLRPKSRHEKTRLAQLVTHHLLPLLASRRVSPVIYQTFPLESAVDAHHVLEKNSNIGKVVLITNTRED